MCKIEFNKVVGSDSEYKPGKLFCRYQDFPEDVVKVIHNSRKWGMSAYEIAREVGVTYYHVKKILEGTSEKLVTKPIEDGVEFITSSKVAKYLGTTRQTLSLWRFNGVGPPSHRVSKSRFLYSVENLKRWKSGLPTDDLKEVYLSKLQLSEILCVTEQTIVSWGKLKNNKLPRVKTNNYFLFLQSDAEKWVGRTFDAPFLSTIQLGDYLGKSPSDLKALRLLDEGPSYLRLGPGKIIRYYMGDVKEWEISRRNLNLDTLKSHTNFSTYGTAVSGF